MQNNAASNLPQSLLLIVLNVKGMKKGGQYYKLTHYSSKYLPVNIIILLVITRRKNVSGAEKIFLNEMSKSRGF